MINQLCVVGTVATDPKLIVTSKGITMCSFRLASNERRYQKSTDRWVDGETNWFTVTAFRSLAEHASASFEKGDRVIVAGKLRIRTWEKEGRQGTGVDLDAEALGHDLRWGTTVFSKNQPAPQQTDSAETTQDVEPETHEAESAAATVPHGHWGDLATAVPY